MPKFNYTDLKPNLTDMTTQSIKRTFEWQIKSMREKWGLTKDQAHAIVRDVAINLLDNACIWSAPVTAEGVTIKSSHHVTYTIDNDGNTKDV